MNKQIPSTEALDEQERELARIVRALPAGEPSAALDARILKSAANAAASSRRPGARWLASTGALWGMGGAAAAVLALGISWQMMNPSRLASPPEAAPAAKMADVAGDSIAVTSAPPLPSTLVPEAAPAAPAPPAPALPPPAMQMPEPFAVDHPDEQVAARAEAGASAETASNVAQAAKATAAQEQLSQRARNEVMASGAAAADTKQSSGMLAAAAAPAPAQMEPADWLAHVRQLLDDNQTVEATASLREFHQRYPDFVIPPDLAPLLRE